jgi:folylpolyglutamate synthase/dihydropteroate synthase
MTAEGLIAHLKQARTRKTAGPAVFNDRDVKKAIENLGDVFQNWFFTQHPSPEPDDDDAMQDAMDALYEFYDEMFAYLGKNWNDFY